MSGIIIYNVIDFPSRIWKIHGLSSWKTVLVTTKSAQLESNLIQHWQPGCILFGDRCGKPPALLRRGVRISGNPGPFQVPRWCRWCLVIQNLLHKQVAKLQGEALEGDHSWAERSSQDPQRTSTKQSRSPMFPSKSNYQLVDDYVYIYIYISLSIYLSNLI